MTQKLDVGNVFTRVFDLYGKNFATLLGVGAVIFIPVGIVSGILSDDHGAILLLLGSLISLVGTYLFTGTIVRLVQDLSDGRRDSSVGDLMSSVMPVLFTLIVVGILASIGIFIGAIFCIVPGLLLATIWAVVIPVVVIEKPGVFAAFGRSYELVKGHLWQTFAVILVFIIGYFIVGFVISLILLAISKTVVLAIIAEIVRGLLLAPFLALVATVLYYELTALSGQPAASAAPVAAGYAPPAAASGPAGPATGTDAFGNPVNPPAPAAPPAPPAAPEPPPAPPTPPAV